MQSAIPAQERPARNALTVALNYATRTRKSVMDAARSSVRPACPSIQCSTPKLHQRITGKFENEKELKNYTKTPRIRSKGLAEQMRSACPSSEHGLYVAKAL